jgi:O-antigen/teichoic acid export membrane protein
VLKAIRKLKTVALLSTLNIFFALFITLPIYYYWRLQGVLTAILSTCLVSALTTVYASYRYSHPILNWSWRELKHGVPMLKLGACFVLTGMMAHGMELLIMSHINNLSNEVTVGLYRAGYTITGTYAALLFNAVSTDFFPRLSGVVDDLKKRNTAVCQQMEVLMMLVGPMTVALLVAMPILVPILYSNSFVEMIPMARISVFSVLLGAIYIPAAYLPLAAGDSKMFLLVETISTITMTMILVGFTHGGLFGAGVGKVISALFDVVAVMALSVFYYKIRISRSHLLMIISHLIILIATYALTSVLSGWEYWITSVMILAISIFASWKFYKARTDSMQQ